MTTFTSRISTLLLHLAWVFLATLTTVSQATAAELVMVEQTGCEWCARWNEEIAPIYPKTTEGAHAPLQRVQLRAIPDDIKIARPVLFTPTFLIIVDGHEKARLEGYPGEDFFWPILEQLLVEQTGFIPAEKRPTGS